MPETAHTGKIRHVQLLAAQHHGRHQVQNRRPVLLYRGQALVCIELLVEHRAAAQEQDDLREREGLAVIQRPWRIQPVV
jgi:hypothetical protein